MIGRLEDEARPSGKRAASRSTASRAWGRSGRWSRNRRASRSTTASEISSGSIGTRSSSCMKRDYSVELMPIMRSCVPGGQMPPRSRVSSSRASAHACSESIRTPSMSKTTAATAMLGTLLSMHVITLAASETSLFGEPAAFEGGLTEVAPGTFAWLQPNGDLGESNAGLVVGEGESALVDTLWDVRLTRRMLDAMSELTASKPITHDVNTHSDGDHWWGNQLVPNARRITSRASAEVMVHELDGPARLEGFRRMGKLLSRGSSPRLPRGMPARMHSFGTYIESTFEPYDFTQVQA